MRLLLKKLLASTLGFTRAASLLAMVPVLLISDNAFAGTLETLTFSRNKVASIYDSQGRAPLDCYRNSGTCGGTKTATYEESVPSGGYFKVAKYADPNRPSMFYVCDAANACTGYGTGNIYAYKPGEYFLFRVQGNRFPKRDGLLVFSLGSANPYLASNGSTISWSFDSAILGQGIYNSHPTYGSTSVTGTYRVGDTLTGTESYSGVDVEIFSRQWKRSNFYRPLYNVGGTDITNATTNSYTLTDADLGQYIRYTFKTRNMLGNGSYDGARSDYGSDESARSDYVIVQAALSAALTPELGTYTRTANGFIDIVNFFAPLKNV